MEKEQKERRKPPSRGEERQGAGKDSKRKEAAIMLRFSLLILNASALAVPESQE